MAAVEELAYLSNQLAFETRGPSNLVKSRFYGTTKRCNGASALGRACRCGRGLLDDEREREAVPVLVGVGRLWSAGLATTPSWT